MQCLPCLPCIGLNWADFLYKCVMGLGSIGYGRVSTEDQTIELQRDALKRARCRELYEEHATGKNTARPQLEACFKACGKGIRSLFADWTGSAGS